MLVRYHPEDLSRVFVSVDGRTYHEARHADLRLPAISLWEQRQRCERAPSGGSAMGGSAASFGRRDRLGQARWTGRCRDVVKRANAYQRTFAPDSRSPQGSRTR